MNLNFRKLIHLSCLLIPVLSCIDIFSQSKYSNDPSILRDPTGYKLRSGDTLTIYVIGEPETNLEATLDGDGLIKPVYLRDLKVSGLSLKEIEKKLTLEYQSQLIYKKPYVKAFISKYSERVVYISGSVNNKGPYILPPEVEAMNIVEVIARAGGFNPIAQKRKFLLQELFTTALAILKKQKLMKLM